MNICGIVCEYNPFHNGHAYQISEIRRLLGEDTGVICVMSGDFVQRGEAACYAKHDRARAAVCGGADLVLELPLPWSLSSAEGFARGAVELLAAAGTVTHLAFGSECGDLAQLQKVTNALLRPETAQSLREKLSEGLPFAAARQQAVEQYLSEQVPLLKSPNDILAIEYLKALQQGRHSILPLAIQRRGAGHDSTAAGEYPSASLLRQRLWDGQDASDGMPAAAWKSLCAGEGLIDRDRMETAILSRLRFLPEEAFAAAPDAGEGLYRRIVRAARTAPTLESMLDAAATKRYPKARLRRVCLCTALGVRACDSNGRPPYLRVLAANAHGTALLRGMEESCTLPILTKPGKVRELDAVCLHVFSLGADAADLYSLCYPEPASRIGDSDWRKSPAIVK